jgi:hypothetical protein
MVYFYKFKILVGANELNSKELYSIQNLNRLIKQYNSLMTPYYTRQLTQSVTAQKKTFRGHLQTNNYSLLFNLEFNFT